MIIAVGHSAGGHLALWLAARQRLPRESALFTAEPLRLRGVVALAGIPDLRRAFTEHVCDDAVGKLLGGSPAEVAERCHQTSPVELLPLGVPQRLIHGDRDPIVPFDLVEDYEKVARGSGDDVRLIVLQHAGHFESVSPLSLAFETVQEQVLALMNDDGRR